MAELVAGSVLPEAGAGCAFHNHPRPLDSAEIEKATAAASTTLDTSSISNPTTNTRLRPNRSASAPASSKSAAVVSK